MAKAQDDKAQAAEKAPKKAADTAQKKADEGKLKALGLAMEQITKQFGDGSIMKLGEFHQADVEVVPSGALSLDLALGGGYPKGRIIEIYGPESSGKTTLTLHAIAEIQKQGGTAAFVFQPEYIVLLPHTGGELQAQPQQQFVSHVFRQRIGGHGVDKHGQLPLEAV